MSSSIAGLRREVAAAAADAVEGETEGTAEAEAPESKSDASSDGSRTTESSEDSTSTEASDGTVDGPSEYFGYKLPPDLTPEQRGEFISELKKRDDTIGKLLRGKDANEPAVVQEQQTTPEPMTDAEILQAFGLDPENPFDEQTAKAIVPLVRKQIEQDNVLAHLIEIQELNDIDRTWRGTLAAMEQEFGVLPTEVTHDSVMEFAADNNIQSPVDAYWRIVGPGRQIVEGLVSQRKLVKNADKASASSTRPGGAIADGDAPLESKTTKGATKEAATRILRDLGLDA